MSRITNGFIGRNYCACMFAELSGPGELLHKIVLHERGQSYFLFS